MKHYFLYLVFFLVLPFQLAADELDTLKQATIIADQRLSDGIFFDSISNETEFELQAGKQIEFALISLDARELLTEDWYDLSLYCLARKHKQYNLAIRILQKEYQIEKYHKLQRWIKSRLVLLNSDSFKETNFDIVNEINDFRKRVF